MKKLLHSPKFWAITIGAVLGSVIYYFLGDGEGLSDGFVMLLIGAYSGIAFADKMKDIVIENNKHKQQQ